MKDWWPRILVIGLLLIVVGVPFLLQPVAEKEVAAAPGQAAARLVIITPHNEQIRYEMAHGFNRWRAAQNLPPVDFDWRSSGGTSDLRRMVFSLFAAQAQKGQEDAGIGIDLFFGGGDYEHNVLAKGFEHPEKSGKRITLSVPIDLPAGLLQEVYPTPDIGGEPLYHPQLYWVGPVLSSFGIVYNRNVLLHIGQVEPQTWSDLEPFAFRRNVALGDPLHSGSVAAVYNAILRRMGWTEGWAMLRRISANARYFTDSASKVPVDVSAGETAAGMCIDFYGRFQAGAIGTQELGYFGDDRVGYVSPVGLTLINADPISILRGAPSHELANQFVVWLLSKEAQRLWQRKLVAPDGPVRFELRRVPIRRDLYTPDEMQHWADELHPFEDARPFAPGMPHYYDGIKYVLHAMAIDIHDELQDAWDAINRMPGDDPRRERMLAMFDTMPPALTLTWPDDDLATNWRQAMEDASHPRHAEAAQTLAQFWKGLSDHAGGWRDQDKLFECRLAWTRFYRQQYRQIIAMAK
ncbi:MAG: extracellular solute-binding protein [Phycisphaeraceae bacterium]